MFRIDIYYNTEKWIPVIVECKTFKLENDCLIMEDVTFVNSIKFNKYGLVIPFCNLFNFVYTRIEATKAYL